MKKLLTVFMLVLMMLAPIGARAAERNWWPVQIDESDQYYVANNRTPKGPLINSIAKTLDVSCDWLLGMKGGAE